LPAVQRMCTGIAGPCMHLMCALDASSASMKRLVTSNLHLCCADLPCAHALHALQAFCPYQLSCSRVCWISRLQPAAAVPASQLQLLCVCRHLCTQPWPF
jgi:hypothetical protein